jgi:3-hydroxyisobutyrate dehydrogenase-like beta-hydroxyacid dehydrogenase
MAVVGILHPGEMGASVGAALVAGGHRVLWVSEGRSGETRRRAERFGLQDTTRLAELASSADVIMSICPPAAALDVARGVSASGFSGVYVDANAVSPGTARTIGTLVEAGGARFVDGDLIGGPARPGTHTRLYLSGPDSSMVAELFPSTDLVEVVELGREIAAASALKMCYAGWTKGTAALLLALRALARATDVEEPLLAEWRRSQPDLVERLEAACRAVPKAWRFAGEMEEIARAFSEAGLPGSGFHASAAQLFQVLARFKMTEPDLDSTLAALAAWQRPRPAVGRKGDVMAKLTARHGDAWVATASPGGDPHLVPLSYAWDGRRLIVATPPSTPTARNLGASGKARVSLGATRDVVMIDVALEKAVGIGDGPGEVAEIYAAQADWDPRLESDPYEYLLLRPERIQVWRQANEIEGRTVMRDGIWLS